MVIIMYSFQSRVRYSEVGYDKKLELSSIVDYFQDCSTFQSEDLGVGLDYFEGSNRAWLLSSWQIVINDYPSFADEITTSTWPYDFKGIYGYRNFIIQGKQRETLAYANSIWVYIDTNTGRPVRISPNLVSAYKLKERLDMDYAPRKIAIPKDLEALTPFPVVRANIDTNKHVNNGQYIKMGEEFLPADFKIRQMRADYRQAAKLGDIITPRVIQTDDSYLVVLSDSEGKPYTTLEFK